jgi:hypothetical protein
VIASAQAFGGESLVDAPSRTAPLSPFNASDASPRGGSKPIRPHADLAARIATAQDTVRSDSIMASR